MKNGRLAGEAMNPDGTYEYIKKYLHVVSPLLGVTRLIGTSAIHAERKCMTNAILNVNVFMTNAMLNVNV